MDSRYSPLFPKVGMDGPEKRMPICPLLPGEPPGSLPRFVRFEHSAPNSASPSEDALRTMAAYIDLNPIRAKLVADPRDYRWCGYAEAVAGKIVKPGLRRSQREKTWREQGRLGHADPVPIISSCTGKNSDSGLWGDRHRVHSGGWLTASQKTSKLAT